MGKKNKSASKPKVAQERVELDGEAFSCSICLDVLKDPVTTSCGHSYCMSCIKTHWDEEDQKGTYSCPQCRTPFKPRPVLKKNIMLAALLEQLKKSGPRAAPADPCWAGPEDVSCDVCSGRKLKAVKSCLVCLASYCEKHIQPHYDSAPLQRHRLVDPCKKLQENICSAHDEVMKMFCRTDQKCICYLCSVEEHKGHDTVSAAAERAERQRELQVRRDQIQQEIQNREGDVKLLQQEVEAINVSANKTVEDSEEIFTHAIRHIQKRSSEVNQQIRSQQEAEVSRVRELQEQLEQEMIELKRRDAELEQLSLTEDHNQFLHSYPSVSALTSPHSSSIWTRPRRYFEYVRAAVHVLPGVLEETLRDVLQDVLRDTGTNASPADSEEDFEVDFPPPQPKWEPEPRSRAGFLRYSREITLDPNTMHASLFLSEGNRKITVITSYECHNRPDRFRGPWCQVLSRESLTDRCYWEVELSCSFISIAVAYKDISRMGQKYKFGQNKKSWALYCYPNCFRFYYNCKHTSVSGPGSSRIGVYLDHGAGILSFYSVSDTMTLLHRVQATFTQPLHVGVLLEYTGDSAAFCKLT